MVAAEVDEDVAEAVPLAESEPAVLCALVTVTKAVKPTNIFENIILVSGCSS